MPAKIHFNGPGMAHFAHAREARVCISNKPRTHLTVILNSRSSSIGLCSRLIPTAKTKLCPLHKLSVPKTFNPLCYASHCSMLQTCANFSSVLAVGAAVAEREDSVVSSTPPPLMSSFPLCRPAPVSPLPDAPCPCMLGLPRSVVGGACSILIIHGRLCEQSKILSRQQNRSET